VAAARTLQIGHQRRFSVQPFVHGEPDDGQRRGAGSALAGSPDRMPAISASLGKYPLGAGTLALYTVPKPVADGPPEPRDRGRRTPRARAQPHSEREFVKQAEDAAFVDLIACERDCRSCSYAAALDCDGNCGVCPHNGYCPCVNPVVARSKTALRLIELRPILLQDLQGRN
jgi:hypothetical protein